MTATATALADICHRTVNSLSRHRVRGGTTLAASVTYVDDVPMSLVPAFRKGMQTLVDEVFCGGHARLLTSIS
ncbi:hypothetical protein WEI85_28665 [Actinomycetes bacterium KLBMP 9797]